jgi:hypothetical protein
MTPGRANLQHESLVPVVVDVLVTVHQFFVPVGMLMDKVGLQQEIRIREELLRLTICYHAMICPEDNNSGRQLLRRIQVLGAENQAFPSIRPADQKVDEIALASWIESGRGLVEEKDLGMQRKHRSQGHLLLLTAG